MLDRQNIRFNELFFSVSGTWRKEDKDTSILCAVKIGSKKVFKRNKKEYEKLSDHIGQFPVVMISPYDRDLISEGSELRRKWIDGIISQFDRQYLEEIQRYAKVLEQRNALLKNMHDHGLFDRESIEVWNEQLSQLAEFGQTPLSTKPSDCFKLLALSFKLGAPAPAAATQISPPAPDPAGLRQSPAFLWALPWARWPWVRWRG